MVLSHHITELCRCMIVLDTSDKCPKVHSPFGDAMVAMLSARAQIHQIAQ